MAVWIIWLIVGVAGILFFTALVVPQIMVKLYAATLTARAKAVKRVNDDYGGAVTYVPSAAIRQYIKRYRIGHDDDGVYFVGELARKAAFAEYEITVYNVENEVIQILRVKEKFNDTGETSVIRLPKRTDYVTLRLICLDDEPVTFERRRFSGAYAAWLAGLCFILSVMSDLLIWLVVSFILRCEDNFTSALSLPISTWAALLGFTALAVVFITSSLCLGSFFLRKRGDKDE